MNLLKTLKIDTWTNFGSYLSTQITVHDFELQVAFCKSQKTFFINIDQFLLHDSCTEKRFAIGSLMKQHTISISEVNGKQRFIPLSAIHNTYSRLKANGTIQIDTDFIINKRNSTIVINYFKDMPIMDIKEPKQKIKNTFNFKKFKIEYSQDNDKLFFKFVDISKALGYKNTPYDTFANSLDFQYFGGEESKSISFKNLFLILDKIKGDKKELVRELIVKITSHFFNQKKSDLMVDKHNEIIIIGTSAIPYKREFETLLFQTRNLMYHLGYKGDGGFKDNIKNISDYFEDDSCYYVDIKKLPELRDSFKNKEYKDNLTKFIRATNKFKR